MRLFDSHAHIGLIKEDPIEQLIIVQEARQADVVGIMSICNNLHDFFKIYENLKAASQVYFSIGVSPSEVDHLERNWESQITEGIQRERVLAIGEIGLDYYRKFGDRDSQIELFIRQLELAHKLDVPVIIHNREAGRDVMEILRDRTPSKGAVLHCYSEDWNYAQQIMDMPIYISFAGNITYRTARNLQETARNMPLDKILVESESPFMVPSTYRGKRNHPSYLIEVLKCIATLRELELEEVAEAIFANTMRFLGLDDQQFGATTTQPTEQ